MPLVPQGNFTFKHTDQSDTPNVSTSTLKGQWDIQSNELKVTFNNLIIALEKTTVTSGAEQIGSLAIADIAGTTIRAQLLSLRDQLKSIVDGTSGADFIAATAIAGLTGGTVQALLEALKTLLDTKDTAQTAALTTHKSSGDHDGRYFTETELQSTTDSSSGADKVGATLIATGSGTQVQAILEWLYLQITNVALGQIADGSLTDVKLSDTAGQIKARFTSHLADNSKQIPHIGTTTNISNAYSITTTETIAANQKFTVKINAASTGAATLNVSSIGSAKAIKKAGGLDATLKIGVYTLFYDGVNFQSLGEGGEYGTANELQVLTGYTVGKDTGLVAGTMPNRAGVNQLATAVVNIEAGRLYFQPPTGFYDGTYSVYSDDADFIAANIKSGIDIFGKVGTLIPPIVLDSLGSVATSATIYGKRKQFTISETGTVRISFQVKNSSGGNASYARIYKNGVAFGAEIFAISTAPVTSTLDMAVNAGDTIELWSRTGDITWSCIVENFTARVPISSPYGGTVS